MQPGEQEPVTRRPQYHFFYGSTDDTRSSTNTQQEQESLLLGESLVPTDNEEEAPNSSDYDLQHVLISNGPNDGVRHVMSNGHSSNVPNNNHPKGGSNGHPSLEDPKSSTNQRFQCCNLLQEHHPTVHIIGLVICMTVCMVVFAITLFPAGSQRAADALGGSGDGLRKFVQTFPTVDRSKTNDPLHLFLDKDLFHPNLLYSGSSNNNNNNKNPLRVFNFAFPTGAFWTNLVLPPTADRGISYPIAVYPYAYKWADNMLVASYPALHRKEEPKAIHDYFKPDLTFSVTEKDMSQRYITNFDPLSVTLQFSNGKDESWSTYLVQGSPYVTIEYDNVTPTIRALSTFKNVICPDEITVDDTNGGEEEFDDNFNDDDAGDEGSSRRTRRRLLGVCGASVDSTDSGLTVLRGVQFVLQSQEGVNWIAFSSEPISFVYDTRRRTTVVASKVFKGTIRLAIIPPSSKVTDSKGTMQVSSSTGLRRLVYHASVYPVGATVDYDFRDPAVTTTTTSVGKTVLSGLTGGGSASRTTKTTSSSDRVAAVHFQFQTKTANSNANAAAAATGKTTGLLMLSLPHHATSFTRTHVLDSKHFDLVYQCIKGTMTPVVGSIWTYEEKLLPVGFEPFAQDGTSSILSEKAIRRLLADNLEDDLNIALPTRTENIYGFGKQIARLGQLAHIADALVGPTDNANDNNKTSTNSSKSNTNASSGLDARLLSIKNSAMEKLSSFLELLLTNQLSDSLLYDASVGGLVSSDGLADFNADFGNGRYNDHHFHYGYLLFACAMLGKLNATFVETYGDRVDAIMHDVAHNTKIDDGSFFPLARHMSWFDGHSFASGLFPFGNGKSQESSSEAVNCYYGASLWSLVRSGFSDNPSTDTSAMTDFSRLLLAMEVRGARTYWHMMPPSSSSGSSSSGSNSSTAVTTPAVYSPEFEQNYMVGNLGMLDAICSTWFGTQNLYVHMINFLPVTPITRELFDKEYVAKEYADVISQYGQEVEMAWRGYVVCDHALVSPMKAWKEAVDLVANRLDSGLSKTQVLYFILTSPSGVDLSQIDTGAASDDAFVAPSSSSGGNSDQSSSGGNDDNSASCSNHRGCAGLTGLCCPTGGGSFLYCCNSR
ncbi:Endo-1,3(4)-beta-glucanase [Seminavis robusta]|uniref:glucan endo-1,3-beta-D-glucosidase n=1 Tax=Seminavis robusta TaxID=568900 RepID=A0A9N8E1I6_9STRA|nr:Endo-1,3(4)-beta-glucanase [Seminavis robusta]|eukprot:Sro557_g166170.1 Endo-1,3(4)-beta-glucanase (1110) ;mRNA; r:38003-41657